LALALKIPLTNYGIGCAKSGNGNYYGWMEPSGIKALFADSGAGLR
jgi:hypothetical protein